MAALAAALVAGASASVLNGADLSNFQNEYACSNSSVLIVRPRTVRDIQTAVALHTHVQASGAGHSWNQPFFCASATNDTSAGAPTPAPAIGARGAEAPPFVSRLLAPASRGLRASAAALDASGAAPSNPAVAPPQPLLAPVQQPSVPPPAVARRRSVNIALTTLRPRAIGVNVTARHVWVDASVVVADLLAHLASYVTADAPAGWTLPAFPWFVYQTVGGAVATGTHGSSLVHGSLSSAAQLLGLEVVTADGSLRRFTPESAPFLFRALRVSVGRLGIITRVQLRIVREVPVRRSLAYLGPPAFLAMMRELQDAARAAGLGGAGGADAAASGDVDAAAAVAAQLPKWVAESQMFWVPQKHEFLVATFARADAPGANAPAFGGFRPDASSVFASRGAMLALGELTLPADAAVNLTSAQLVDSRGGPPLETANTAGDCLYAAAANQLRQLDATGVNAPLARAWNGSSLPPGADPALGDTWLEPVRNPPSLLYGASNMAEGSNEITRIGLASIAGNATVESSSAYIKQPNHTLAQLRRTVFDQYEVSFPLAVAADCWGAVLETAYGADLLGKDPAARAVDKGFRTAPLIRLVGAEEGLLSHTHDGPRMYLNLEDYLYHNAGRRPNQRFRAIMATLRADPRCTARGPVRLHWGKAGWPDAGCWRGDVEYGVNWCSFGCAVRELDPGGKFADSAPDRWTWRGVDLPRCCGPNGFNAAKPGCECRVQHSRPADECPPAPFYTER